MDFDYELMMNSELEALFGDAFTSNVNGVISPLPLTPEIADGTKRQTSVPGPVPTTKKKVSVEKVTVEPIVMEFAPPQAPKRRTAHRRSSADDFEDVSGVAQKKTILQNALEKPTKGKKKCAPLMNRSKKMVEVKKAAASMPPLFIEPLPVPQTQTVLNIKPKLKEDPRTTKPDVRTEIHSKSVEKPETTETDIGEVMPGSQKVPEDSCHDIISRCRAEYEKTKRNSQQMLKDKLSIEERLKSVDGFIADPEKITNLELDIAARTEEVRKKKEELMRLESELAALKTRHVQHSKAEESSQRHRNELEAITKYLSAQQEKEKKAYDRWRKVVGFMEQISNTF